MTEDAGGRAAEALTLPFTDQELFEAFRIGSTPAEARQRVAGLRRNEKAMREHYSRLLGRSAEAADLDSAEEIAPSAGMAALSDVDVVILSLLSEETRLKVERYRAMMYGPRGIEPEAERWWQSEREQWRAWVAEQRSIEREGE